MGFDGSNGVLERPLLPDRARRRVRRRSELRTLPGRESRNFSIASDEAGPDVPSRSKPCAAEMSGGTGRRSRVGRAESHDRSSPIAQMAPKRLPTSLGNARCGGDDADVDLDGRLRRSASLANRPRSTGPGGARQVAICPEKVRHWPPRSGPGGSWSRGERAGSCRTVRLDQGLGRAAHSSRSAARPAVANGEASAISSCGAALRSQHRPVEGAARLARSKLEEGGMADQVGVRPSPICGAFYTCWQV